MMVTEAKRKTEGLAGKRVLVVEDDPSIAMGLRINLESEGYLVDLAADGERGLELARRESPDLMVLDLMLPRMDGYKVCRALKFDERYRRIVIVILSARTGETDRRLAFDLGADAYVTKPYDVRALVGDIRNRLGVAPGQAA